MSRYPNLELLDYKTREILKNRKVAYGELTVEVFIQTWGSTALGFGGFGGQMMTSAYTTVFSDELNGIHVVFFDGRPAYLVLDASDEFYKDLKNRDMKSVSQAGRY